MAYRDFTPDVALGIDEERDADQTRERVVARQRAWLKRSAGNSKSIRPRKRHRKDAQIVLKGVDHTLHMLGYGGIDFFHVAPEDPRPAIEWPLLSISSDQGPPETAAWCFLHHGGVYNCDEFIDPAHAVNSDMKRALRDSGLMPHSRLFMLASNVEHGPHEEDMRYHQVVGAVNLYFSQVDNPENEPGNEARENSQVHFRCRGPVLVVARLRRPSFCSSSCESARAPRDGVREERLADEHEQVHELLDQGSRSEPRVDEKILRIQPGVHGRGLVGIRERQALLIEAGT